MLCNRRAKLGFILRIGEHITHGGRPFIHVPPRRLPDRIGKANHTVADTDR